MKMYYFGKVRYFIFSVASSQHLECLAEVLTGNLVVHKVNCFVMLTIGNTIVSILCGPT